MFNYLIISILPILIISVLILINFLFSFKSIKDREKPSPFECGFNPFSSIHSLFSIQFFLTMMIFLVFDIEIILLMPIIPSIMMNSNLFFWFLTSTTIILILFISLFFEWNEMSLSWAK